MSLDLFLESEEKVKHTGTGIYIRENGKTKELLTKEEVLTHFPDTDPDSIIISETQDNEVWHENITHNLGKMASQVPIKDTTLYYYLWRPEEIGFLKVNQEYIEGLEIGLEYLRNNKEALEAFNPENGWGSYDNLLEMVESLVEVLKNIELDLTAIKIIADR